MSLRSITVFIREVYLYGTESTKCTIDFHSRYRPLLKPASRAQLLVAHHEALVQTMRPFCIAASLASAVSSRREGCLLLLLIGH